MHTIVYKIPPLINNSFEETLKQFVNYKKQEYNVEKIIFTESKISPDKCQIGDGISAFRKPHCIFISLTFMSEKGWTNKGGHEYCTFKLKDKSNIYIGWNLSSEFKDYLELDIKFIRKIKLQNLAKLI
jgi:hypothetical protein